MAGVRRSVGTQGVIGYRQPLSIWYVFIPSEVDRNQYIANCNRTNTISVINDNGEILHKVKIGKMALQEVKYPQDQKSVGSPLLCGNILSKNRLIVIDVFDSKDDFNDLQENESALIQKTDTGVSEVRAQGDSGIVIINVDSSQANGGKVFVNVSNSENAGELIFNVNGSTNFNTSGDIGIRSDTKISFTVNEGVDDLRSSSVIIDQDQFNATFNDGEGKETIIKYVPTEGFSYVDEFENEITINEDNVLINGKTAVNIGEGGEAMVLGDTLSQLLKDFITEIAKSTTAQGPLLNASLISAYVSQVDTILSQYSKTK